MPQHHTPKYMHILCLQSGQGYLLFTLLAISVPKWKLVLPLHSYGANNNFLSVQ